MVKPHRTTKDKDKMQPRLPEDLNAALLAMQVINKVFWDYLFYGNSHAPENEKGLLKFNSVVVVAPFALVDIDRLKKAVTSCHNEKILLTTLQTILKLAVQSITLYNDSEGKQTINRTMYYELKGGKVDRVPLKDWHKIVGKEVVPVIAQERIDYINNHPDKQVFNLYWEWEFKDFCEGVSKYATDVLEVYRRKSQDKLIKQPVNINKHATAQIALFFYYLRESKAIPEPGRKFFLIDQKHKQKPYNFDNSGQKVYLFYLTLTGSKNKAVKLEDVLANKNLKAVIRMLKNYPAAQGIAKNALVSKGIE